MIDFANNDYHSGKKANKGAIKRGFLITMFFVLGGLGLVVADHVGHDMATQRATEVASR
jgi:uncharacterized protein YqgC (DUF456 family)